jgi:hypothetical protein
MISAAQAMFDPDVEEALLRVYGVDVQQATLRRVHVLLTRLPSGSWHKGNGPGSWSTESYLLASVIDAVNQMVWVTVAANSKKAPKPPKPIPRPGAQEKEKKSSWSDLQTALTGMEGVVTDVGNR